MEIINKIAFALVIIGALNWGLVGFFNFDVVAALFGVLSYVSRVIYGIIGLSAIWVLLGYFRTRGE